MTAHDPYSPLPAHGTRTKVDSSEAFGVSIEVHTLASKPTSTGGIGPRNVERESAIKWVVPRSARWGPWGMVTIRNRPVMVR